MSQYNTQAIMAALRLIAIALFLELVNVTTTFSLELEAEDGSGYPTGAQRPRSAASNDATVALNQGQSITLHFSTVSSCTVSVSDVAYTNDGGADTISVSIDGTNVGSFQTVAESNAGHNWNVVRNSGSLANSVSILSGSHTVRVTATSTDQYGVEIDKVSLFFNNDCIQNIQCIDPPNTTLPSSGSCDGSRVQGSIVQRSVATGCAEEDNIHVPIYFNNIREFSLTATLPGYATLTRANNRNANFTNCELASRTIWMLGNEDMMSAEFSNSCTSLSSNFHVNNQTTHICGVLNNQHRHEVTLTFIANGPSSGEVESSIGSILTVQFAQVTGTLAVEASVYGRSNTWESLGQRNFTSTLRSFTWQTPDLTWVEGDNRIRLIVIPADSSINAVGTFDYIKLEKRQETGEYEIAEVYNDGITIVKAIGKDFWWLHPQSMVLRNTRTGSQWSSVVYLRVLRKIPSINSWPEVFVLYQDGNSRILTFPPSGIDWIPFGSSVIIGSSDPDLFCPYAAISLVNFDPRTLKFTLHFSAGGQAVLSIATNITTTTVTVSDITYATNTSHPFATFRSMWVSKGNSDVDHVRRDGSIRVWHIMQDGWTRLTGNNFLFFRKCVSQHNTLSPDIRVEIQCIASSVADSTTTDSSTRSTALIATETMSSTKYFSTTSSGSSTSKGRPVSATESDSQGKAPSAADDADTKTNQLLIVFIICFILCCCC